MSDVLFEQPRALSLRQRLAAMVGHCYPFYSGCGTIANHPRMRSVTGQTTGRTWVRHDGARLLCPMDDYVGRAAIYVGDLDRKITWILRRIVREGDTVLDIGANIGLVSTSLARRVGKSGTVHSFEPNPAVADLLAQSKNANPDLNIHLHRIALGDAVDELLLHVPRDNAGSATLRSDFDDAAATVRVPVMPLTDWAQQHGVDRIDFIKIDVEGFEPQVFRGGLELLNKTRPRAIVFEHSDHTAPLADHPSFQLLSSIDYRFFTIPRCLTRMKTVRIDPKTYDGPRYHDFVAVPADRYEDSARLLRAE